MNTDYVREFVRLAQSGGFRAAADELHLSASALSKHVATLEAELGYELFERSGGRTALTGPGERFYCLALQIVDLCDRAAHASMRPARETVVVGTPYFVEEYPAFASVRRAAVGFRAADPSAGVSMRVMHDIGPRSFDGGEVDCVLDIWTSPEAWLGAGHPVYVLDRGPMMARIPWTNPLSRLAAVSVVDLAKCQVALPGSPRLAALAGSIRRCLGGLGEVDYVYKPGETVGAFRLEPDRSEPYVYIVPKLSSDVPGFQLVPVLDSEFVDVLAVRRDAGGAAASFERYIQSRFERLC